MNRNDWILILVILALFVVVVVLEIVILEMNLKKMQKEWKEMEEKGYVYYVGSEGEKMWLNVRRG